MKTADAVVIGAGINGASTAYNLVKRGLKNVVVIEKHLIASGGTGKTAGICRRHYSNPELIELVRRAVDIFANFSDVVGGDPGFVNCGWAFLVPEDASDRLTATLEKIHAGGVNNVEISKEDLKEIEPRIDLSDVGRVVYDKESGYADPHAATYCYIKRFLEMGGELQTLTPVTGISQKDGALTVQTPNGGIESPVVVNAAGPWADRVGAYVGLDVPIKVTRESEIIIECADVDGPPRLCYSDMAKAIYYRPAGPHRALLGRGYPKPYEYVNPDKYEHTVDPPFIEEVRERFHDRLPRMREALMIDAYVGLYDVTPDWHPILGKTDVDGFYMCAGFSGHGFKTGPAVGEALAEEILDGGTSVTDLSRFSLNRFKRDELFTAAYGGNRA